MELLQTPRSYRPDGPPESPYLRARQEWDERMGSAVSQAKNWRLAFVLISLLCVGLVGANIIQLNARQVIPMVIAVGAQTGEATVLGRAGATAYQPGEPQIKYFILQFIKYVRTVPVDPVVVKSNWLNAYKFLRREAAQTLNAMTNSDEDGPLKRIGLETVTIQPRSVLAVPESKSYQVRWTETVYDSNGQAKETYSMTGLFTIEIEEPSTEEAVLVNPLGIFIKSFQWNRDLGGETP